MLIETMAGAPLGNNNAGKNKAWDAALRRAIAQDDANRLRRAAEQLLDQAANGEQWAIKELADRLDGKAHQSVDNTSSDGSMSPKAFDASGLPTEILHAILEAANTTVSK